MNLWMKSLLAGCVVAIPVYFMGGKIFNRKSAISYNIQYTIKVKPDKKSPHPFSLSKVLQVLGKRLEVATYQNEIKIIDSNTLQVSLFRNKRYGYTPCYINIEWKGSIPGII